MDRIVKSANLSHLLLNHTQTERRKCGILDYGIFALGGVYYRRAPVETVLHEAEGYQEVYNRFISSTRQPFDDLHVAELSNAILVGQGAVITSGGFLINDSYWEALIHLGAPPGLQPRGLGSWRRIGNPTRRIERPSIVIKRPWWRNYGHWMVDAAALLALLANIKYDREYQIVIGAHEDDQMRAVVNSVIGRLAPRVKVIEHRDEEMWEFDRLLYVTPVHHSPMFKLPAGISALRSQFTSDFIGLPSSRRIFVRRQDPSRRALENEAAIAAVCESFGFVSIIPERYSFLEQVELFRSADVVVGVKGAGLTNILFSSSSTAVIALSPGDFPDPFFWELSGQLSQSYYEIFGRLTATDKGIAQNPFEIDVDVFSRILRSICSYSGLRPAKRPINSDDKEPQSAALEETSNKTKDIGSSGKRLTNGLQCDSFLAELHAWLQPQLYAEIALASPNRLGFIRSDSIIIDPFTERREIEIKQVGGGRHCRILPMTAQQFFDEYAPNQASKLCFDLVFIDSSKSIQELLYDLLNIEKYCNERGCIVVNLGLSTFEEGPASTGVNDRFAPGPPQTSDLWKLYLILTRYRPDIFIRLFDTAPDGLLVLNSLNPASEVLAERFTDIIAEFTDPQRHEEQLHQFEVTRIVFHAGMLTPDGWVVP